MTQGLRCYEGQGRAGVMRGQEDGHDIVRLKLYCLTVYAV